MPLKQIPRAGAQQHILPHVYNLTVTVTGLIQVHTERCKGFNSGRAKSNPQATAQRRPLLSETLLLSRM